MILEDDELSREQWEFDPASSTQEQDVSPAQIYSHGVKPDWMQQLDGCRVALKKYSFQQTEQVLDSPPSPPKDEAGM